LATAHDLHATRREQHCKGNATQQWNEKTIDFQQLMKIGREKAGAKIHEL
jgi:hypothetical protein